MAKSNTSQSFAVKKRSSPSIIAVHPLNRTSGPPRSFFFFYSYEESVRSRKKNKKNLTASYVTDNPTHDALPCREIAEFEVDAEKKKNLNRRYENKTKLYRNRAGHSTQGL